ncbi:MAG: hypothetical protein NVS2B17_21990 [Candidatus Velthaea sp.]
MGGQAKVPPVARPMGHLPVIDFVATFTQPAYYTNMSQLPGYDPIDLGGTVRIPITRKLSASFDRITEGTINQPLEQQAVNGVPILPKDTRDVILQYRLTDTITPQFSVELGESFRHRIYASGGSGVSTAPYPTTISSTEHHFAFLGLTYTTKPWREFLHSSFSFALTGEAQNVDHHVGVCTTKATPSGCSGTGIVASVDENPGTNRYYETTQGITWIVPVDSKHGTVFTLNERWGYLNFYENTPFPWHYPTALTEQLSKKFSPGFSLALRHADLHEAAIGAPFPAPNVIHVGSWDVIGTFHLDLNTVFGH